MIINKNQSQGNAVANLNDKFEQVLSHKNTEDSKFLPSSLVDRETMAKTSGVINDESGTVIIAITDYKEPPKSASKADRKKRQL